MSKIKESIIHLLALYPEEEFYAQEIANKLSCSKASASLILKDLTKRKIVQRRERGHMKFYQINESNIEVKRLKTDLAIKKLSPLLVKLNKASQEVILFGSVSRGEQTFNSDIDLLIVTNNKKDVEKITNAISSKKRIRPIVKTPSEWAEMEESNPDFYREVKSGITLEKNVSRI